jgi:Flp pilus assembly protein TadG
MRIVNKWRRRLSDALPGAQKRRDREEGQALVEFALVMPILLLVLFAIIQFGLVLNNYITVTDSARAGARELALERGNNDPCDPAVTVATNAAKAIGLPVTDVTPSFALSTGGTTTTQDFCVGTINGTTTTQSATPYTYPAGNTLTTETNPGMETQGDEATVSISEPYTLKVFGFGLFHLTLSASATDAVE